jgi:hypothetical protein
MAYVTSKSVTFKREKKMSVATKISPVNAAIEFVAKCRQYGWNYSIRPNGIVTIEKAFAANDKAAFAECDMDAYTIFDYCPLKGGSIWGTDGGSIGGAIALGQGVYRLNKSGSGKAFLAALAKVK